MKYLGSKRRLAKYIIPEIVKLNNGESKTFVEPFCGGCNLTSALIKENRGGGWFDRIIASDLNKYLIAMFKDLQNDRNDFPTKIDEALYKDAKNCFRNNIDKYDDGYMGWVGFMASFNGTFFDSYNGNYKKRDYISEGIRNIMKQIPSLKEVEFYNKSYDELEIPKNSFIYCDPPYKNTSKYCVDINHDKFFDWCREQVRNGNKILVSEYNAPEDFKLIYEITLTTTVDPETSAPRYEKLFTYEI